MTVKPLPPRFRFTFLLDLVMLISACALQIVPFTGGLAHEWLGLAFGAMMIVHLLLSWPWVAAQSTRLFTAKSLRTWANYLLNALLFVIFVCLIVSGIFISEDAVPAITATHRIVRADSPWEAVHGRSSDYAVILVGLHLALNWDWSLAASRQVFRRIRASAS
jgi:cytochrome b561